ncbi:hypothetical protein ACU4IU_00315 [Brevibacterium sp. CSND-B09]|uniref:hypothetical protein n=1 Tax=Brevibacterium sp. CSND-B09 TaxID=3462571 RepID=UPI00406A9014
MTATSTATSVSDMPTMTEFLDNEGIELSNREANLVAITTARTRAVTAAIFMEFLIEDESVVEDMPQAIFEKIERFGSGAAMQYAIAGILIDRVREQPSDD